MKAKYVIPITLIVIILASGIAIGAANVIADFEEGDISGWDGGVTAINDPSEAPVGSWYGEIDASTNIDFSDEQHTDLSWWVSNNADESLGRIQDGNQGDSLRDDVAIFGAGFPDANEFYINNVRENTNVFLSADTWYHFNMSEIDYTNEQYDLRITDINGNIIYDEKDIAFMENNVDSISQWQLTVNSIVKVDHIVAGTFTQNFVDGTVIGRDQQPINNVNITANETGLVAQTNSSGYYEGTLVNGTYKLTANKSGYAPDSEIITLAANSTTVDFRLLEESHRFNLEVNNWMKYDSSQRYRVNYIDIVGENNLVAQKVTSQANVTSSNPDLVSVDDANNELISTNNTTKSGVAEITAEYTSDDGELFFASQNVTVAPRTIDNIGIMPSSQYFNTFLGLGQEGTVAGIGSEIQWIWVIIIFGTIITIISNNEWLGLGAMTIGLILFWLLGFIGVGKFVVSILFAIALGLSLTEVPKKQQVNIEAGTTQDDIEGYNEFK